MCFKSGDFNPNVLNSGPVFVTSEPTGHLREGSGKLTSQASCQRLPALELN